MKQISLLGLDKENIKDIINEVSENLFQRCFFEIIKHSIDNKYWKDFVYEEIKDELADKIWEILDQIPSYDYSKEEYPKWDFDEEFKKFIDDNIKPLEYYIKSVKKSLDFFQV